MHLATDVATLHRLDRTGLIVFSGVDAQSFLQGQLSCDVAALADGRSTYGSYCTPQGRVVASFLLWRARGDYCMHLPRSLCASIQRRLSMYILRAKVKATHASERHVQLGIAGNDAFGAMKTVFGEVPAAPHDVAQAGEATLIRLAADRFQVIAPSASAARLCDTLKARTMEAGVAHWEWLDIRAGIPWITPPTQEQFVPQMVNLDLIGGVSFSKGCYPGQEIVARAHYRGQVKQRMYLAHLATDDSVRAGDKLYSAEFGEQSSGTIVNAAPAPQGGYDALAVTYTSSAQKGDVRWNSPGGPRLEIMPLPYAVE